METCPILTEINNGILKSKMAMPMKDLTSDNESSFEMNRKLFQKTYTKPVNFSNITIGNMVIQRQALGLSNHQAVIDGHSNFYQKKWIGGNRDASQVTTNRRVNTTGASLNSKQPTAFTNVVDHNTAREALRRSRSAGSIAPAKKIHKYKNAPVFY